MNPLDFLNLDHLLVTLTIIRSIVCDGTKESYEFLYHGRTSSEDFYSTMKRSIILFLLLILLLVIYEQLDALCREASKTGSAQAPHMRPDLLHVNHPDLETGTSAAEDNSPRTREGSSRNKRKNSAN